MVGGGENLIDVNAPHDKWLAALDLMWNDEKEYASLSEQACQHAYRPEVAPGRLADKFLELVTDFVAGRDPGP